jgi:hypothetical protein
MGLSISCISSSDEGVVVTWGASITTMSDEVAEAERSWGCDDEGPAPSEGDSEAGLTTAADSDSDDDDETTIISVGPGLGTRTRLVNTDLGLDLGKLCCSEARFGLSGPERL